MTVSHSMKIAVNALDNEGYAGSGEFVETVVVQEHATYKVCRATVTMADGDTSKVVIPTVTGIRALAWKSDPTPVTMKWDFVAAGDWMELCPVEAVGGLGVSRKPMTMYACSNPTDIWYQSPAFSVGDFFGNFVAEKAAGVGTSTTITMVVVQ